MPEPTPAPSNEAPPDAQASPSTPDPSDALGESGEKALEAWKSRAREAEKAAKRVKALEAELQTIRDKDKSESERLTERLSEAEKRAERAERASLRFKVGNAKGLPARLTERLQGDTEEEMAADADALLAEMKPKKGGGDWDAGTRTPAPAGTDMNATLRRMAGRGA